MKFLTTQLLFARTSLIILVGRYPKCWEPLAQCTTTNRKWKGYLNNLNKSEFLLYLKTKEKDEFEDEFFHHVLSHCMGDCSEWGQVKNSCQLAFGDTNLLDNMTLTEAKSSKDNPNHRSLQMGLHEKMIGYDYQTIRFLSVCLLKA